jgi:hypothetical protein
VIAELDCRRHPVTNAISSAIVIQPKGGGIMVEILNAVSAGVRRPIQFVHLPVPQPDTDAAYFACFPG